MAASAVTTKGADHTVELVVLDNPESAADGDSAVSASQEIKPLLTQSKRPKINIFAVSRSGGKPRDTNVPTCGNGLNIWRSFTTIAFKEYLSLRRLS
ncbi:hypothetical protein V6N12_053815 [Hibiscus sabdariffa]|uniref:Uncharacterized protein n=1 Tax=Hibiscus sabdariffa TaxID=183260 RepID=A0ABR2D8P4_9ROSI